MPQGNPAGYGPQSDFIKTLEKIRKALAQKPGEILKTGGQATGAGAMDVLRAVASTGQGLSQDFIQFLLQQIQREQQMQQPLQTPPPMRQQPRSAPQQQPSFLSQIFQR